MDKRKAVEAEGRVKDVAGKRCCLELHQLSAGDEAVKRHLQVVAWDFWRIFFLESGKLEMFLQQ